MKILITESQLNSIKRNNIEQPIDEDISAGSIVVYHRTRMSEENIKSLNSGFIPGDGQAYGRGLYSTYDLNSQLSPNMRQYGNIVVEFSITKFDKILVLNADECKKIYGRVLSVDEQMKKILKGDYVKFIKNVPPNLKNYIPNTDVNGPIANQISRINNFQLKFDGMVFIGGNDGKVLVLFETNLVNPLRYTTDNGKSWKSIKTKESLNIGKDNRGYGKLLNYLKFKRGSLDFQSFSEKNKYEIITQKIKNKIPLETIPEYEFYIENFKPSDEEKYNIIYGFLDKNISLVKYFDIEDEKIQLMAVRIDPYIIKFYTDLDVELSEQVQLVAVQQDGFSIRFIKNPSEQVKLVAVQQDGKLIKYIKNPSEQLQLAAIKQNAGSIFFIENPSEEVQLAAVNKDGNAIYFIENPSEEVQLAAVNKDGYSIQFINNPLEQVQLVAVQKNGYSIQFINNPSEQLQLVAVQQDGYSIQFIKNPSEQVQLAAIKQNGYLIQIIKNPSEQVQLASVQQDGKAIGYIMDKGITPSEQVQLASVRHYGRSIRFIENPSKQVQLAAVKQDGNAIRFIKNPPEQLQLVAVKQDGKAIEYIKNPSEQVLLAAVQQDGNAIGYIFSNGNKPSMELVNKLVKVAELSLMRDQPINEDVFKYDDLTDDEKNKAYEIFRDSYQNATGSSWDKMKFSSRASNWTFYGVKDKGFVVVRKQKSGMNKLTGVAGDLKSISIGIEELNKLEEPTWGMADKKIVSVLTGRYNFISPPAFVVKMLIKFIPSEVFGGTQYVINKDGSLTFNYSDVGDATKYFFGNKKYFQSLLKNVSMNSIVKFAIQKLIS